MSAGPPDRDPSGSNLWEPLRRFTQARVGLGRAGHAVRTATHLEFQLAHAQARDAVHLPWSPEGFAAELREKGIESLILHSQAAGRTDYLQSPERGRRLAAESETVIGQWRRNSAAPDIALIVSDGLSSAAVQRHGSAFVETLVNRLRERTFTVAPVFLVKNGRVAISDGIGAAAGAKLSVMVIGERPGLSSADSLGVYLTYSPEPGLTDARRNCLSNIRPPEGMDYELAARKLLYLVEAAIRLKLSGVGLKDESDRLTP